jgi:hypothetical protein
MASPDSRRLSVQVPPDDDREHGSDSPQSGLSPSALVLVPEPERSPDNVAFDFSDDDDRDGEPDGADDPLGLGTAAAERLRGAPIPALSPARVLLFLLAPGLKLGALLLPAQGLPLALALPVAVVFAALAAGARQLWYMLARYVGAADVEAVVASAFARAPRRARARRVLRTLVRGGTAAFRLALAALYLRGPHALCTRCSGATLTHHARIRRRYTAAPSAIAHTRSPRDDPPLPSPARSSLLDALDRLRPRPSRDRDIRRVLHRLVRLRRRRALAWPPAARRAPDRPRPAVDRHP